MGGLLSAPDYSYDKDRSQYVYLGYEDVENHTLQNPPSRSQKSPGSGSGFEAVIEVNGCCGVDAEKGISPRPRRNAAPRPGHFSSLRSVGRDGQDRSTQVGTLLPVEPPDHACTGNALHRYL